MSNSSFIAEFKERGFFHQCTDMEALDALLSKEKISGYIGFDCTATSLHVGSLMQLMIFRLMQKHGHKPIVLMGGGTTKIGDPTFKDEARKMLDYNEIEKNKNGIKKSVGKFIKFGEGENDAIMADNNEWLSELGYIDFLRDYGRHFSVNRMLTFDSVKLRLEREQSLSFLEFNYMLLQAYDFVELNRRYKCRIQFGGSDQWGNIVNGVELQRRLGGDEIFGLTTPLITTSSGAKMGKTASGAIWLNDDMLSPYDYYQFWRNTEDADVGRFLRMFTDLEIAEIVKLEALQDKEINEAKKILAFEATKLCHGLDEAKRAEEAARKLFEEGGVSLDSLPFIEIPVSELGKLPIYEALHRLAMAASSGEARRLVRGGGARINDVQVQDEMTILAESMLKDGVIKISAGKKKHGLVKVS